MSRVLRGRGVRALSQKEFLWHFKSSPDLCSNQHRTHSASCPKWNFKILSSWTKWGQLRRKISTFLPFSFCYVPWTKEIFPHVRVCARGLCADAVCDFRDGREKIGACICKRACPGADPGKGQGGPAEFWPPKGGGLSPKFAPNRGFSLKIAWKLHDFKKNLEGKEGPFGSAADILGWCTCNRRWVSFAVTFFLKGETVRTNMIWPKLGFTVWSPQGVSPLGQNGKSLLSSS